MDTGNHTAGWQQPPFGEGLDAVAVDLITAVVQQVFADLDPLELAATAAPDLSAEERAKVAELIDSAVVELDIDFSGEDDHHDHDHHDHDHDH